MEQWTIVWHWVSIPGAAGLGHWLAVLSRRPWWVSMSDCWSPTHCSSWPAATALAGLRQEMAWPLMSQQSWWPDSALPHSTGALLRAGHMAQRAAR